MTANFYSDGPLAHGRLRNRPAGLHYRHATKGAAHPAHLVHGGCGERAYGAVRIAHQTLRWGVFLLVMLAIPATAAAIDAVRLERPHSVLDRRHEYNNAVLEMALEKTRALFGAFTIHHADCGVQRDRALVELISGTVINVDIVPTQRAWEEKTLPIRIPIAKGVLGYRLFLIHQQNRERFTQVQSVEDLKALRAGLRQQWVTTRVMKSLGFPVVTGSHYEGLFEMLAVGRFDYFPRGINEIFTEYNDRSDRFPEMRIEPTLALYLPQPIYIFVSPKYPALAKRIETGLLTMIHDGDFDRLFWQYHSAAIRQAGLRSRRIIRVNNPLLTSQTPLRAQGLWLDPLAKH
ncbi:MAG: hypothetical protein QNJ22_07140 [Desulfosarcinaceae bacterium]|nr:hypothetical protein [Desulfosarcinaceae bacterium]